MLQVYRAGGKDEAFYRDANACVTMDRDENKSFRIHRGMRQKCKLSLWLFSLFTDKVQGTESN